MLKGKTALITGSTSGIGLGIAHALAQQGADIVLNGFGEAASIERLRGELSEQFGIKASYVPADVSKPDEIYVMIRKAQAEFGGVDILVNNAGIQYVAPIHEFPIERWDAIIAINLSASFHTIRAALPKMLERNWGRIINISSAQGLVGSIHKAAYNASKHGLIGLTKSVGLETATTGITCNAICPGWVITPLILAQVTARAAGKNISQEAAKHELLNEKQPSGEFVTTEQLGALAVFLCSESAAQMRGLALPMDGGWTVQ